MRIFENGTIVYVDVITRNCIKINLKRKELASVNGVPIPKSEWKMANIHARETMTNFADEGDKIIWLYSQDGLAVLDPLTMEHERIPDFWLRSGRHYSGCVAIANKQYSKFCGIGLGSSNRRAIFFRDINHKNSKSFSVEDSLKSTNHHNK